jgi:hypothetical protein
MTDQTDPAAADLLYGVSAIAKFLGVKKRAAYHLIETRRIPTFKLGKTVAAKRSRIVTALEAFDTE